MRKVKYAEIGNRIRSARIAKGLKQKQCLAPLGDITPQMLSDWEKGYVCPSLTYLVNISKFYGVSLDYIVLGKPDAEKEKALLTYKDVANCLLALKNTDLFTISGYVDGTFGTPLGETLVTTYDKTVWEFREELANITTASKSLSPELLKQALADLVDKYDKPISNRN